MATAVEERIGGGKQEVSHYNPCTGPLYFSITQMIDFLFKEFQDVQRSRATRGRGL